MDQDKIERICQLPPLQHGVLFEALRQQDTGRMIYQARLELTGPVRPDVLRTAWRAVLRRHPSLRSSYHYERLDTPVQVVRRDVDPPWQELDWRGEPEPEDRLAEFLAADRQRPFELTRAPLLRLTLVQVEDNRSWLVWSLHPLLVDGWSFYLVLADVFRCYRDLVAGRDHDRPPPRPHWEYVSWLQRRGSGDDEEFWRNYLADLPVPVSLGDHPASAAAEKVVHGQVPITVPDELAGALDTLARTCRVTLSTVVHAAWGVTLSRYCGLADVVFGGIVSGRDPAFDGIDDLVGVFMNNQPVRAIVSEDRQVADWLVDFQVRLGDARQYDHVPLATVQRCAPLPPDVPLFESFVDFTNYPMREQWADAGDVRVAEVTLRQVPLYPLALVGAGGERGWKLFLSYDTARFTDATATGLAELFTAVLAAFADRPSQRLTELPGWTHDAPAVATPATPAPAGTADAEPAGHDRLSGPVSELINIIWAQALDLPDGHQLDETSNFFDLGGHSLVAIRLVSKLRSELNVDFTVVHLFADPTVGGSARAVAGLLAGDGPDAGLTPIPRAPAGVPLPASFAQERLWFVDQLDADAAANNLLVANRFPQELDADAMRTALAGLIDRHEVLRTCLREQGGAVVQVVLPEVATPLHLDDFSALPLDEAVLRARAELERDLATRFDLGEDAPVRARLIRLAPDDTVLAICLHHAAYDGWSADVLTGDLAALYEAAVSGTAADLAPLPVQYADFSLWQRERFSDAASTEQAEYWRAQLAGVPDVLRLGTAADREPDERTGEAGMVSAELPPDIPPAIRALSTAEAVTPYMILLAAHAVLLARHSGRDDIVIGSPVADRDHPDLEPLIGLFVNTQVLRVQVGGAPTFRQLLTRVRQVCLDAMVHRGLPFEKLVSMVSPSRSTDRTPLVQMDFQLVTGTAEPVRLNGVDGRPFPAYRGVPRFELIAQLYDRPKGLACVFHFAEDIYRRDFVERLLEEYVDLVTALVTAPDRAVVSTPGADAGQSAKLQDDSRALLRSLSRR